jgi:uncharacterized protein YgiM (DUF1202 family)
MAKAMNYNQAMIKVHKQALKSYLAGKKQRENFQIMLNAEMHFWKKSDCGLIERYLLLHDMLIRQRKAALRPHNI